MDANKVIFNHFDLMLGKVDKEKQIGQKGHVFWLYGLSGSGKSTLANSIERLLVANGYYVKLLDGDNLRSGLNKDLEFDNNSRYENIRRIAEVANLFLDAAHIVLVSCITPKILLRDLASKIIGQDTFTPIYLKTSFEKCQKRDVKGLYQKASKGLIDSFTGIDSKFEIPDKDSLDWIIDTDSCDAEASSKELYNRIISFIKN